MLERGAGLVLLSSGGVFGVVREAVVFEVGFKGGLGGGNVVDFCSFERVFCSVCMSSFMLIISLTRELGFKLGREGWMCGSFEVRLERKFWSSSTSLFPSLGCS